MRSDWLFRRTTTNGLFSDALSHAMLAGVTSGYLITRVVFGRADANATAMLLGALLAALATVGLVGFVKHVSRIKDDAAIGIMYTGIFAFGGLLASAFHKYIHVDLNHFLIGSVLGLADDELWLMAGVTVGVLAIIILFFRHFQLIAFDPVMAASLGVPVLVFDYLLTCCTSLVVVSAVPLVGVVLVVGMLITPAATAYLICNRLSTMLWGSALFGSFSTVLGIYLAEWAGNIAVAPTIVVVGTLQFLVVMLFAPGHGVLARWLRRRTHVPQQLIEDVLRTFGEQLDTPIPKSRVFKYVDQSNDVIHRALRRLVDLGWLRVEGDTISLTVQGQEHTLRLLRAHRLWESYLYHVGTPAEELHDRAHQLEHMHEEEVVDYLDDKLGHPLRDPHGAEIPEDFEHLASGKTSNASLLREGHRARVTAVKQAALPRPIPIEPGMIVVAGPREDHGETWTFQLPNGEIIRINHDTADQIFVELL